MSCCWLSVHAEQSLQPAYVYSPFLSPPLKLPTNDRAQNRTEQNRTAHNNDRQQRTPAAAARPSFHSARTPFCHLFPLCRYLLDGLVTTSSPSSSCTQPHVIITHLPSPSHPRMPAEVEQEVAASSASASKGLPPSLPPLSTSSPSTSHAPSPCESPDNRSRVTLLSTPPLVDYVCCFSHERAPFAHTCDVDFLSVTAVLKGHLDYCVPSAASQPQLLPSVALPDALQYFVYPTGIRLLPTAPPAHSHSFVLTLLSGERLYAVCRTVWQPVSGAELSVVRMQLAGRLMRDASLIRAGVTLPTVLYAPHSVCLISRHSFPAAYSSLLQTACSDNRAGKDEADALFAALYNVRPTVAEAPGSLPSSRSRSRSTSTSHSASSSLLSQHTDSLPSSAITSPSLSPTASIPTSPSAAASPFPLSSAAAHFRASLLGLLPSLSFVLPATSASSLPHLDPSSLCTLLLHLSPSHIALLLNVLLCETSVLLVSSSLSIVSPCCEALSALLWPLRWPYIFIPLLPAALSDFFQAPQPFLIGVERDTEQLLPSDTSVCVVDLDHNTIEMRGGSSAAPATGRAAKSKVAGSDSPTNSAASPFVPPASFVSLPHALSWRVFELLSRSFPAYSLLHADEQIVPPSSLPSAAVPCVIAAQEEERDRRERKESRRDNGLARGRPRRRLSPCNVDNVDSRYRKPLLTLSTCRLLHSGTEGEDVEASRAQLSAVDGYTGRGGEEEDGAGAASDVSMDVSLDESSGASELTLSNAVSPALHSIDSWRGNESPPPIPFLRQESEPITATTGFLPVPLARPGSRSSHQRKPSIHRSSSSPPARVADVPPSPLSAATPQSPPSPAAARPAPTSSAASPFLPASFTMSSAARDTDELSAVTPVSAYPALTTSRSFDSNQKRRGQASAARKRQVKPATAQHTNKEVDGLDASSASTSPAAGSAGPPSPASVIVPSPTITSPVLSALESDRFSHLYDNDGLIALSANRATRLRRGFLSLFVSLFRPYQQGIRHAALAQSKRLAVDDNSANLKLHFDSSLFLSLSHLDYQPFLRSFLDSQLVKDFLLEKIDAALASHPHIDVSSRTEQSASQQPSSFSSSPATPSSVSFSIVPSVAAVQPVDAFDVALSQFQRRHARSQRMQGSISLSGVVWKLGASLPTWRERTLELQSGSRTIRCFSVSNKMIDVERRYKAMKEKMSGRRRGRHNQPQHTDDDAVLQASIDRLHEQRAAMRNQLRKGVIKLERGQTSISVPDERKQYPTPWLWELRVRDNRWLLCSSDRQSRDAWIRTILARTGPYQSSAASVVHSLPSFAESALQTSLRLLREEQMRQFTYHIQHKVERLLSEQNQTASSTSVPVPHSLPLFTSTHTRRSLSSTSNTTPLPSPHPAAGSGVSSFSSPSASSLSRALLCAELLLRHLHLRELTSRFRTYQHCFLGSEAVKYMMDHGLSDDVAHCIHIGNTLISCRVIQHVHGQFVFKADDSIYQFVLHTQHQPPAAAQSASVALPASLVCTPLAASHNSSSGHPFFPSLPPFSSPTAEDELLLRSLQSSLHVRTHTSGLFGGVSHPNTFRGSDCIDWLVDNGVMKDDTDAVRWCSRMCRMGLITEAAGGLQGGLAEATDFRTAGTRALYRFTMLAEQGEDGGKGRRGAVGKHEAIQEEKDDELVVVV